MFDDSTSHFTLVEWLRQLPPAGEYPLWGVQYELRQRTVVTPAPTRKKAGLWLADLEEGLKRPGLIVSRTIVIADTGWQ